MRRPVTAQRGYSPFMIWRAYLKRDQFDLELLAEQFDRDPARVGRNGDDFWLESPSFDSRADAAGVQSVAQALLREMNGAARLIDASFRAVDLQGRFWDGTANHVVLATDTIVARSRVGVATVVIHDAQGNVVPPPPPAPTKGPIYLAKADGTRQSARFCSCWRAITRTGSRCTR